MKHPLSFQDIPSLPNHAERLFVQLFFQYRLSESFEILYEWRLIQHPQTHDVALPDFEITPKDPEEYPYHGCIIELTYKRLNTTKKHHQRQVIYGWLKDHPDYFFLELTHQVMTTHPYFVAKLNDIFQGKVSSKSIQGKIAQTIQNLKSQPNNDNLRV